MAEGYKTHDPARQATSMAYQESYIRGLMDAMLLDEGRQPRGIDPRWAGSWMGREGYSNGLNVPRTPIQRASKATRPAQDAPWRQQRGDNERRGTFRPGPWQVANVGPDRHDLWTGRDT